MSTRFARSTRSFAKVVPLTSRRLWEAVERVRRTQSFPGRLPNSSRRHSIVAFEMGRYSCGIERLVGTLDGIGFVCERSQAKSGYRSGLSWSSV